MSAHARMQSILDNQDERGVHARPENRPIEIGAAARKLHSVQPVPAFASLSRGSSRMKLIWASLDRIANSDVPLLVQGESGVGKEVFARQVHATSRRAGKPFLKLNCAAVPSELLESELFGYEKGAFTGAIKSTPGLLEMTNGGTILLDEIGDMDVRLQAKLLHVLQDYEFQRVGGRETIRVNVRLIAATHRDLQVAIRDGLFREDLYYRLNVLRLEIPPLRERKDEILSLARLFVRKHAAVGMERCELPVKLQQAMLEYSWPGNIRQLENMMQRLMVLQDPEALIAELTVPDEPQPIVEAAALSGPMHGPSGNGEGISLFDLAEREKEGVEKQAIRAALDSTCWHRKKAASLLGVKYKALLYKMKKLGISA